MGSGSVLVRVADGLTAADQNQLASKKIAKNFIIETSLLLCVELLIHVCDPEELLAKK
jgi:hypothetical protein